MSGSISVPEMKLLWSRSGNRCAFPDCNVLITEDNISATEAFPMGEMAHIVGEKEHSARWNDPLPASQRNRYDNLILLCPTHHARIDKDEGFSVSVLHAYKAQHEAWVTERLTMQGVHDEAATRLYALVIESASTELFDNWTELGSDPLRGRPRWTQVNIDRVRRFREKVLRAPFAGRHPELEAGLTRLSLVLIAAIEHWDEHAEYRDNPPHFEGVRFYHKLKTYDPQQYNKLLDMYEKWIAREVWLMREATRVANWVCDAVRRDINPYFYLEQGRFLAGDTLYQFSVKERDKSQADPAHSLQGSDPSMLSRC